MLLLLAIAVASASDDTFHPGPGPELVSYADLVREGGIVGRTGRVLVHADSPDDGVALAAIPGVSGVRKHGGDVYELTLTGDTDDLALARSLHGRKGVRWAVPDLVVRLVPDAIPDDPLLADQWHLENTGQGGRSVDVDIDADDAWAIATGAGQRIAIIDSGVQLDHPDLTVVAGHDYVGKDDDPSPDWSDSYAGPHGTCTAGLAAAKGDDGYGVAGVAWQADVYAVRLVGGATTYSDTYDAMVESVDAGASVLSNSWGLTSDCSRVFDNGVFQDMIDYAEQHGRGGLGSPIVFAAGNGGCDVQYDGLLNHDDLVVVAAVEADGKRAWYSNYGEAVDISAPTTVLTTDWTSGGYGSYGGDDAFVDGFNGTSAATPIVSGVLALMFEANPRLTAAEAREVLCETAVRTDLQNADYDDAGWSPYYGCGLVDAGAAVTAVADTAPSAPSPTLLSDDVWEGRAVLAWTSADDPDGDVTGYEVAWWRAGEDEASAPVVPVDGEALDVGPDVVVGDVVSWKVRAVDPWGPGEWSATESFTVVAEPVEDTDVAETKGGCDHTGGAGVGVLLALGLTRRRSAG